MHLNTESSQFREKFGLDDNAVEVIKKLQKIEPIRDATIGLQYEVPCVDRTFLSPVYRTNELGESLREKNEYSVFLPIIPTVHDDVELGFPFLHVHYDFRFFYEFEMREISQEGFESRDRFSLVRILRKISPAEIKFENRYCFRKPGVPPDNLCGFAHKGNELNLQDLNSNKKHLDAGVCPHKGHRFSKASVCGKKGHEVLHCPLHGLKFKMSSGKLLKCKKHEKQWKNAPF